MTKLEKKLLELSREVSGNVLSFGLSNQTILQSIQENKDVVYFDQLHLNSLKKESMHTGEKENRLYLSDFRKKYKKKKIDSIFCEYSDIEQLQRLFLQESHYITKGCSYYFGIYEEEAVIRLMKRCEKLKSKVTLTKFDQNFILTVIHPPKRIFSWRTKFYMMVWHLEDGLEMVGNMLAK